MFRAITGAVRPAVNPHAVLNLVSENESKLTEATEAGICDDDTTFDLFQYSNDCMKFLLLKFCPMQ